MARLFISMWIAFLPFAVWADGEGPSTPISLEGGVGFTADPDSVLLAFAVPWEITDAISIGPLVQFGLDDDYTIIAPSMNARYAFDLSASDHAEIRRLRPHLEMGVGFAYAKLDGAPSFVDDDDTAFLMNFGIGAEYRLTRAWSLGSRMRFNVLPGDLFAEDLFYSWEVAGFRFRF